MSTFLRTAKSASDWTNSELSAYNIAFDDMSPNDFFPPFEPSVDHLDPAILSSPPGDTNSAISDAAASYLGYLSLVTRATDHNFVVDFAAETLKLLGFNEPCTTVVTRYSVPLSICGEENHVAQADVSLIHNNPNVVLMVLVQDKSTPSNRCNAGAQVVAAACITINGTVPTFYLVPVTTELGTAVATGRYPNSPTVVSKCAIAAAHVGMKDIEYRRIAFKRLLAFKTLAKSHWLPQSERV
ncbi:hypothetical protein CPB83DRAFT_841763 [Crepidotus variabilis]|uniref:Uncharacterized protein n=1 Tax=Crepidotus variabilis TaxID=179855 RepID=A0A9P6EUE6_9AGAR|nr:hypothetical protein CPB83DRAFT_841763 [Crepidotus variabilis]